MSEQLTTTDQSLQPIVHFMRQLTLVLFSRGYELVI